MRSQNFCNSRSAQKSGINWKCLSFTVCSKSEFWNEMLLKNPNWKKSKFVPGKCFRSVGQIWILERNVAESWINWKSIQWSKFVPWKKWWKSIRTKCCSKIRIEKANLFLQNGLGRLVKSEFWNEMLVKTSTNVEPSSSSDEEYDDYDQIPSESTSEICEVMLKLNLKSNKKFRFI